ncbi:TNT domain-containing protein, partial [Streptomyces beihaiensis]
SAAQALASADRARQYADQTEATDASARRYADQAAASQALAESAAAAAQGDATAARSAATAADSDATAAQQAATTAEAAATAARKAAAQADKDATAAATAAKDALKQARQAQAAATKAEESQDTTAIAKGVSTGVPHTFAMARTSLVSAKPTGKCQYQEYSSDYCKQTFTLVYNVTVDFFYCADLVAPATPSGCPAADSFLVGSKTVQQSKTVTKEVEDPSLAALDAVAKSLWDGFKADVDKCVLGGSVGHCALAASVLIPPSKVIDGFHALQALDMALRTGTGIADAYKGLKAVDLSEQTAAVLNTIVEAQNSYGGLVKQLAAQGKLLPSVSGLSPDVMALLHGYQPYGDLTPAEFVGKYWDKSADSWDWSTALDDPSGAVAGTEHTVWPKAGERWDRFGGEKGQWLAPEGTAYAERSLPPENLHQGYHRYVWVKDWTPETAAQYVKGGKLASGDITASKVSPGFGQPGMGTQFKLPGNWRQDGEATMNVQWLLDHHFIKDLDR